MQTSGVTSSDEYVTIRQTLRKIYVEEGIVRGFFKGKHGMLFKLFKILKIKIFKFRLRVQSFNWVFFLKYPFKFILPVTNRK